MLHWLSVIHSIHLFSQSCDKHTVRSLTSTRLISSNIVFSAAASELADPAYIGTALTLQTNLGFFLTIFTIRRVPVLTTE